MKKSQKANVPTLAEVSPLFTELTKKKIELSQQRHELSQKISVAMEAIAKRDVGTTLSTEKARRVATLLGEAPESVEGDVDRKELQELQHREHDVEAAIEIIGLRLNTERAAASKRICIAIKPEYEARVRRVADSMLAVLEALNAYDDLKNDLDARDVLWSASFVPMGAQSVRSGVSTYLKEAATNGFITMDALSTRVLEECGYLARPNNYLKERPAAESASKPKAAPRAASDNSGFLVRPSNA